MSVLNNADYALENHRDQFYATDVFLKWKRKKSRAMILASV